MITFGNYILLALALLVFALAVLLLLQIGASLFSTTAPAIVSRTSKIAVIVPAQNESAMIQSTIESIKTQLGNGGRLLVVADNCTDDTAILAKAAGAEVIERRHECQIGKGYALDHGVRFLAQTGPPEVLVFIDADCEIGPRALDLLTHVTMASGRPVQARYIIHYPPAAGILDRISRFAWTVKTYVRPLGYGRLGLPCQLMGTGMAFPWSVISVVNLATGNLAEDLKLGADLALTGKAPLFCPEAQVISWSPPGKEGKRIQRTRWEHGHIAMIVEDFPRLLRCALTEKNLPLLAIALDLSVPPLSLLALLIIFLQGTTLLWLAATSTVAPFIVSTISVLLFGAAVSIAWWQFGRDILSLRDFVAAPFYCVSRIPSFLRFVTHRQVAWIRSPRN